MIRTACIAAVALTLVIGATFAQPRSGTEGAAGPEAQRRSGGFRAVGAFGGEVEGESERTVQLEMEGGQKLEGTIHFRPIIVDSDLGRYRIWPGKIRMIQFLRRANVDDAEPAEGPRDVPARIVGGGMRPMQAETLVRGKVITTSDKVIIGDIHIPNDFRLELEFGSLSPAPDKLRILTLIDDNQGADASKAKAAGRPAGLERPQRPEVRKP